MIDHLIQSRWDVLWPGRAELGESPVFDHRKRCVLWLDIKGQTLFSIDLTARAVTRHDLPVRLCSIVVPDEHWPHLCEKPNTYLCAGDDGFGVLRIHPQTIDVEPICHPEKDMTGNRFNDGKLSSQGHYIAGTMDDAEERTTGSVYALRPDGQCNQFDSGYRVPNGPTFSPDGRVMYLADSALQRIYAYDVDMDGTIGARQLWHTFAPGEGYPDGMQVGPDGRLYVALWDGYGVAVLEADGTLLGRLDLPTARPTSCVFDPVHPKHLYVTSAAVGSSKYDTFAGNLFRIDLE